jgi:hypothetical protein
MRRIYVLALAILVFAAPAASAAVGPSSIRAHVVAVTPTHAVVVIDAWTVQFGVADVSVEYGPTAGSGTVVNALMAVTDGGPALPLTLTGLTPATTYHLHGRLDGVDISAAPLVTSGADIVFTTPKLGGLLLSQVDSLVDPVPPLTFSPSHGSGLHACNDPTPPPAGDLPMSRFQAYTMVNPAAAAGCVTVQVASLCTTPLRIVATNKDFTGDPAANVIAADSTDGPNHEFQFPVTKDQAFTVSVADDGDCNIPYTIAVYSTTVAAPVATTAQATAVGVRSATIQGTASSQALHNITARFQWGPTITYGQTVPLTLPLDTALHKYAPRLRGLKPNTTYHARILITGPNGPIPGADITFRTLKKQGPLKLQSTSINVKSNSIASVKITCPLTTVTCAGSVVLRRATGKKPKLGSKSFRIDGGKSATIAVKLSSSNRKLVKKLRTVKVTATLTGKDGDRLPFAPAKRRAKLVWRG